MAPIPYSKGKALADLYRLMYKLEIIKLEDVERFIDDITVAVLTYEASGLQHAKALVSPPSKANARQLSKLFP